MTQDKQLILDIARNEIQKKQARAEKSVIKKQEALDAVQFKRVTIKRRATLKGKLAIAQEESERWKETLIALDDWSQELSADE